MRKQNSLLLATIIAAVFLFTACKKDQDKVPASSRVINTAGLKHGTTLWTDFMTDNFDAGWTIDTSAGHWWWQSAAGINWAIVHASSTAQKGRAEVHRPLFTFNGTDHSVIIKGKFKMETTADGYTNDGGWIMQTMAWSFKDASGTTQYKPLVVARMLANTVDYLVYDYVWDSAGNPAVKSGYPIVKTVMSGAMAGQTIELALTINFSRGSTGSVVANLNGTDITSANYSGATYPSIFPYSSQEIEWKGGSYSSYYGTNNSKIGVYYLYTNAL